MAFVDEQEIRLGALAVVLRAHGLSASPMLGGLVVKDGSRAGVVITCLPYQPEGGRLWFFTEPDRTPLGVADDAHVMDVVTAVKTVLAQVRGVLVERGLA